MAKIKQTYCTQHWQGCWGSRTVMYSWEECEMVQTLWKIVWLFLKQLNINSAILLLVTYSREIKALCFYKNFYMNVNISPICNS